MEILLDGKKLDLPGQPEEPTLQQIFDGLQFLMAQPQVMEDTGSGPRLIVRVVVDGEPVLPADLELMMGKSVADAVLEFETMEQADVVRVVLQDGRERLREVAGLQRDAAEAFQSDAAPEAFEKLGQAIQGWLEVSQAMTQSATLMKIDLDQLQPAGGGSNAAVLAEALAEQLREVKATLEDRDVAGLADVLGYEWAPLSEAWISVLDALEAELPQ